MPERPVHSIDRPIRAPDLETLSRQQMAAWLNIGVDAFDAFAAKEGIRPKKLGPKTIRYTWMDAVFLAYAMGRKADLETESGGGK